MDACARIRGVPLRTRASIRKETVRDSGGQCVKSLLRTKKELCRVSVELQRGDALRLTEINFVCLPGLSEGKDASPQALSSLPVELCDLLRSLHVHSLRNDEVLLLKDSRRPAPGRDPATQCWLRVVCVLRHSPSSGPCPQAIIASLLGLLGRYAAGIRYALELQVLNRGSSESHQAEEDDTNQSVSSIEDDFVTALEHLEEEDAREAPSAAAAPYHHGTKRDVASQTIPAHKRKKDLAGSRVIIGSSAKRPASKLQCGPEVSITVQRPSAPDSQWTHYNPGTRLPEPAAAHYSESDDSDGSSPSPIIFLDEVGYQKSLLAKLDIPQVPGGPREPVEDSDSEVSEFFDSFDQFDDLDELSSDSCTLTLPLDLVNPSDPGQKKKKPSEINVGGSKYVSRGCSTKGRNLQRFDQPPLPANLKKPTPLKPGSPYSPNSEVPDSPRPVRTSCEEGPLFSPVSASAFSPLGDSGGSLEYFWKSEGDVSELRKPQDLCSLYKTYSDFASSLSREILGSVCGYQSPTDMSDNKNLSCVCHKEFQNPAGHLMKLSEIQEAVTVDKLQQRPQSLKDGIQRFATDLVEMSLGSALRDLQKGVSQCTTTLCHLAARLTSSVFQMAFHEIGMRRAIVLKERAISGLAGFLVGEAVSGALKEFLTVKKQIFNSTVSQFAADLAEELVFEGIMEVCQFSHPSTPLTPSDWSFGQGRGEAEEEDDDDEGEEVVCSYASDLSESVIQEAFIQLSQADVAFTSQAAISVSLDNVCYVSSDDTSTHTCSTVTGSQVCHADPAADGTPGPSGEDGVCTVKKALFTVSGMASCISVPQAGQALSLPTPSEETCQYKSALAPTSQTSPKRTVVTTASSDTTAATQTENYPQGPHSGPRGDASEGKSPFHHFSGNMVDMIVSEACELMTATKMKKSFGDCAEFFTKNIGSRRGSSSRPGSVSDDLPDSPLVQRAGQESFTYDGKDCGAVNQSGPPEQTSGTHIEPSQPKCASRGSGECIPGSSGGTGEMLPVTMDSLDLPGARTGVQRKTSIPREESTPSCVQKTTRTPGTPPSSPQQPTEVSKEKQIRQFSKKLKGKLAKEFSPATPPPTPRCLPEPGPGPADPSPEADKADFMVNLMRSLSEEAEGHGQEEEDEEEEQEEHGEGGPCAVHRGSAIGGTSRATARRMSNKEAFRYAERLACHIVSMATEMDTLIGAEKLEKEKEKEEDGSGSPEGVARRDSVAQFSEETLNSLWVYAGEVAGEVISDVKRLVNPGPQCPHHSALRRSSLDRPVPECHHHHHHPMASSPQYPISTATSSPGLSSQYPSCESVTDEYAGYLIRVLKKEGGSRELVLDQYASRLAYRSIKQGLTHAARKMKKKSSSARRLHSSRSLPEDWKAAGDEACQTRVGQSSVCTCPQDSEEQRQREYADLVHFSESLAYSITCDVTRKLCLPPALLPKSLTDSCIYRSPKLEDMAENLIRDAFSCPLLAEEDKGGQYHSTSSLSDGGYGAGVMQVIEHYARKIVEDTLEMGLSAAGHLGQENLRPPAHDRHAYADRLSEGACPHCTRPRAHHLHHCRHPGPRVRPKRGQECEGGAEHLLEIPKIQIDLDLRVAFAEEMVSVAMETAKRELSNTSLNADSGIGHDGASYAESLTAEIMTSALSNLCQAANPSSPGRDATESTMPQQLSVGDDSLGSWSNLSFEDEHPDENSSFLHLSDSSNGNSSSWSSLGLEGEVCEDHLSFSPSDSECPEEQETDVKEESSGTVCVDRPQPPAPKALLVLVNSEVMEPGHEPQGAVILDPQVRCMLQWAAASMAELPQVQLGTEREIQQLQAVVQRLRERECRVGDLLQALLRYCEEVQARSQLPAPSHPRETPSLPHHGTPLFQWLLEHF
ncbi:A-kinase anchor protein 11 isoform X1 [Gadus morhua]|uniref:A-kinase anchor protein 11 isoform X1 n=1 Tax=Gadus morhua TaxID=8049 RepID=UPI0011B5BA35|nr:A-kinase anchor protein 11 isoform X1 [Gadus morhua]XP_030199468.1 A-kinase anchor protein 11 isoform X1 [Gadus morhua]